MFKLNKLNQDHLNKNLRHESDLRQLNKTHNSEYKLLKGELKQIREQLQEANAKIIMINQENKKLISQIQYLKNEQKLRANFKRKKLNK
jgi:hypothetical protein